MIALSMRPNVAKRSGWRYGSSVTVNPVADLGRSYNLARRRPNPIAGAFFASAHSCYGGCAWDTFGCAGCQVPVGQPAYSCHPNSLGREQWQFHLQLGTSPMPTRNPSEQASARKVRAPFPRQANTSLAAAPPEDNSHMERSSAREKHGGGGKMNAMVRPVNAQIEAAQSQLFQVVDGWTTAYYVKRTAVGLEFEPLPGGFGHQVSGIDPTQSDAATPVGVLGPFEHLHEAEDALLRIARCFPYESFSLHCAQFASGIFRPVHLPGLQEIARRKVVELSKDVAL